MSHEAAPEYNFNEATRIKLPLALLWSFFLGAVVIGGYVYQLRAEVTQHTIEIAHVKEEARASRELLVRIDENVKQLKETAARRNP